MNTPAKTKTRTYTVTHKAGGRVRLVRTTHPSRALEHVAADEYAVDVATQEDLEALLPAGVKVERPGGDEAPPPAPAQPDMLAGSDAAAG